MKHNIQRSILLFLLISLLLPIFTACSISGNQDSQARYSGSIQYVIKKETGYLVYIEQGNPPNAQATYLLAFWVDENSAVSEEVQQVLECGETGMSVHIDASGKRGNYMPDSDSKVYYAYSVENAHA